MGKNNLCIVASGSGGHILPALTLAQHWKNNNPDKKTLFFGKRDKFDQAILQNNNFLSTIILFNQINLPISKFWLLPKFTSQFFITFFKSLFFLKNHKISKIISTGGYLTIPVCLAGKILKCEIELYELNVQPGKTIKFLSPIVSKIFITFEKSKNYLNKNKCFLDKYPIRFTEQDKIFDRNKLINKINKQFDTIFDSNKKTIFLLGGSKGSLFLNETLKNWIESNKSNWNKIQIIHQCGLDDLQNIKDFYLAKNISAIVFSFNPNIKDFYLISDFVISRAGAGTIFELLFFNKKSILIPLQTKYTNHQIFNAREMALQYPENFTVLEQNKMNQNLEILNTKITLRLRSPCLSDEVPPRGGT
ncbi:MAG: UDP-N-acetylglucosamine--N-acetylmuramyl-(pentapeptide) pyrophosphoryl-undecaprenol N-acetylglucosamine transferase [bacterium]